jgi:hypothetical protein
MPWAPEPMHSIVLLELFQSEGTLKVRLLPSVARNPRHCPPPISEPKPQVVAKASCGEKAKATSPAKALPRIEIIFIVRALLLPTSLF